MTRTARSKMIWYSKQYIILFSSVWIYIFFFIFSNLISAKYWRSSVLCVFPSIGSRIVSKLSWQRLLSELALYLHLAHCTQLVTNWVNSKQQQQQQQMLIEDYSGLWYPHHPHVAAPEFCLGGIEGAECVSEGAKIQKFAQNGWF